MSFKYWDRFISTLTRLAATKLGSVVSETWQCGRWRATSKNFTETFDQVVTKNMYGHQNWHCFHDNGLLRKNAVAWTFNHLVTRGDVTNEKWHIDKMIPYVKRQELKEPCGSLITWSLVILQQLKSNISLTLRDL